MLLQDSQNCAGTDTSTNTSTLTILTKTSNIDKDAHTHTHTHIHIYIYIYIYALLCVRSYRSLVHHVERFARLRAGVLARSAAHFLIAGRAWGPVMASAAALR